MAESDEDFTSSTCKDDLESVQSIVEDIGTEMGTIAPYEGEASFDEDCGGLEDDEVDEDD